MFVNTVDMFLDRMKMGGSNRVLPVQIKSSDKSAKSFFHKHLKEKRFFNTTEGNHQFILCGMDEPDCVLADILGQIVVHSAGFDVSESRVLRFFAVMGDEEAVSCYKKFKVLLSFRWYGFRLPPL